MSDSKPKTIQERAIELYPERPMNDGYRETWDENKEIRDIYIKGATDEAALYPLTREQCREAIELLGRWSAAVSEWPYWHSLQEKTNKFLAQLKPQDR